MNTYDPADRIRYVHLAQQPVAPPAAVNAGGACDPLPAGYANLSPSTRLPGTPETRPGMAAAGAAGSGSDRPALVILPGGAAPTRATGASAPPALRLA